MDSRILQGDAISVLRTLEAESVQCVVTSPPYWGLRDYGVAGQLGLERTPDEYVGVMVDVFREVRRVLRKDGTLWLNLGSSYLGGGAQYGGTNSNETGRRAERMFRKPGGTLPSPSRPKPNAPAYDSGGTDSVDGRDGFTS